MSISVRVREKRRVGYTNRNEKANEDDYFRQSSVGFLSFDMIMTNSRSDFKLLDNRLKSSSFYWKGSKQKEMDDPFLCNGWWW